jgi:hypothetical protein
MMGWRFKGDARVPEVGLPSEETSAELRTTAFEVVVLERPPPGLATISIEGSTSVCEKGSGACLFRSKDAEVVIRIPAP